MRQQLGQLRRLKSSRKDIVNDRFKRAPAWLFAEPYHVALVPTLASALVRLTERYCVVLQTLTAAPELTTSFGSSAT